MTPADVKRLKALELENAKQAPARRARSRGRPGARGEPKKMVSPRARRKQVCFLRERGLSQRRACGLLNVPRSTLAYRLVLRANLLHDGR